MPSLSPSRPRGRGRGLDLAALGRFMPAIDADSDRGFRCPDTAPWVKPHGEECYEDGWKISAGARAYRSARSPVFVDDSCREFCDAADRAAGQLENGMGDRIEKIRELNATLPADQWFFPVLIAPRRPRLLVVADYFMEFCLDETSPTTFGSKGPLEPGDVGRFGASTMLQFFSLKFAGNFPNDRSMLVYGFMAVRDDIEPLRNYVFIRTRDNPCEVKPGSSLLPLICPTRGISVHFDSMVEYALKVKLGGGDSTGDDEDAVLIDGCIQYQEESIRRDVKLKSRIDGPFGPVDMEYAFIRRGVEAVVKITLPRYLAGDPVKLTAFTSGYPDPVILYDGRVPKRSKISSVLSVSLGGQLQIKLEGTIYDSDPRLCMYVQKDILFKAEEYGSSKGKIKVLNVPIKQEIFLPPRGGLCAKGSPLPCDSLQRHMVNYGLLETPTMVI